MPRNSKKNPDNLSPENIEAIKEGCEQSNAGKVSEVDFSQFADDDDADNGESVICPVCGHKCLQCKHRNKK